MNTQSRTHRLAAGESMLLAGRRAAPSVLVQGEALVQAPAQWLAGMLVVPPAVRLSGPALLPADASACVVAASDAVIVVQESPTLTALLSSLVARLRLRRYAVTAGFGADRHA